MTKPLSTGIPSLDELLGGGIPRGVLMVVAGDPGSGKTVLAHQIAAAACAEGTVVYLTAPVEAHRTLLEQASNFEFFDPSQIGERMYYVSIYPAFLHDGFDGVESQVLSLLTQHEPSLVIIDGLHMLRDSAESVSAYNEFLGTLQMQASTTGVTILVISNREPGDPTDGMFTIADGILLMESERREANRVRRLEIRKLRTVRHVRGRHAFEIGDGGIEVFPRLEALAARIQRPGAAVEPGGELDRFAVPGLDDMLGGGLPAGSTTLVLGAPGAGKTSLALAYLAGGFARSEAATFVGFHEYPERLLARGDALHLGLSEAFREGALRAIWHSPTEIPVERLARRILDTVAELDATRVVIDGVDDLVRAMDAEGRGGSFVSALIHLLKDRKAGVLLTSALPDVFSLDVALPTDEVTGCVDNIILLRRLEVRSEVRRLLSILKVRDQEPDSTLRELLIDSGGIRVGARFATTERLVRRADSEPDEGMAPPDAAEPPEASGPPDARRKED
jgi:circadian clock protein KaiC